MGKKRKPACNTFSINIRVGLFRPTKDHQNTFRNDPVVYFIICRSSFQINNVEEVHTSHKSIFVIERGDIRGYFFRLAYIHGFEEFACRQNITASYISLRNDE